MLKFFRSLRLKLIDEGNLKRYLIYAVGEILLVVIGILIALSINNWNQNKIHQKEEIKYYKNIKRQILEDTDVIKNNIDFNQIYYKQYQFAIKLIENDDRSHLDSLAIIAINLLEYSDFHQETNAYQALVSSGEIKFLNNQNIIEGLQRLEELYIYINKIEDAHFEIIKMIYPELNKIIQLNSKKIQNIDLLFEYEFQNYFAITSEIMREKDEIYGIALDEINAILELIDKELMENG